MILIPRTTRPRRLRLKPWVRFHIDQRIKFVFVKTPALKRKAESSDDSDSEDDQKKKKVAAPAPAKVNFFLLHPFFVEFRRRRLIHRVKTRMTARLVNPHRLLLTEPRSDIIVYLDTDGWICVISSGWYDLFRLLVISARLSTRCFPYICLCLQHEEEDDDTEENHGEFADAEQEQQKSQTRPPVSSWDNTDACLVMWWIVLVPLENDIDSFFLAQIQRAIPTSADDPWSSEEQIRRQLVRRRMFLFFLTEIFIWVTWRVILFLESWRLGQKGARWFE